MGSVSAILDHRGLPFKHSTNGNGNGHARRHIAELVGLRPPPPARTVNATYDAARDTTDFENYWANADSLDADSANSKAVRGKLVPRSRYEVANNGYTDGMVQTHANYVVGCGPTLRMQTPDRAFNEEVETQWWAWCKAIQYRRKLWCMIHAKVQDGEGFGVVRSNPRVKHPVKLDVALFETEQCTTPYLPYAQAGYIDGIKFDEFGNPEHYDVLKYHPGGPWVAKLFGEAEKIPATFVLHWFTMRRPGQHRGVPEFRSTLNVGAASRRWREATIAAAESAADIAVMLKTSLAPNQEADIVAPLTSVPFEKRMMTALPMGWDAGQMKGEHPNSTFSEFHRANVSEQGRPKSMPFNLAACDSSTYSFASGKLDYLSYFAGVDIERADGDDLVNDKVFALWFERAALTFGWNVDPREMPAHTWDWPKHPVIDSQAEASANEKNLQTGVDALPAILARAGVDAEDAIRDQARFYGITPDEMRKILLRTHFPASKPESKPVAPTGKRPADDTDTADDKEVANAA